MAQQNAVRDIFNDLKLPIPGEKAVKKDIFTFRGQMGYVNEIALIRGMGFQLSREIIFDALMASKGDIDEAVAILMEM